MLRLVGVSKRYGHTQALRDASLEVRRGEIIGLIGHNGAGKSTLMRVATGLTVPDEGEIEVNGRRSGPGYGPNLAREAGLRIAFQELSLCPSLRVFENVLITHPEIRGRRWRRTAQEAIAAQLDTIFRHHGISPRAVVEDLSLAQRQMLEVARAALELSSSVRLLILDEPTSALSQEAADDLFEFLRRRCAQGMSSVVISHRIGDVLANTDRTVIMRDGRQVARRPSASLTEGEAVALMGATHGPAPERGPMRERREPGPTVLEVRDLVSDRLAKVSIVVRRGEIVGLAGLEGEGQQDLLREVWRRRNLPWQRVVRAHCRLAYVSGDRQVAGVFPLWPLELNLSVSSLPQLLRGPLILRRKEREQARSWISRLAIKGRPETPILDLSGGTQQKVLLARALSSGADLVLLDDPFRGVDVVTKREAYRLLREETERGRSFLWFSTENREMEECDRVYVLQGGRVAAELKGQEISEARIVEESFASREAS